MKRATNELLLFFSTNSTKKQERESFEPQNVGYYVRTTVQQNGVMTTYLYQLDDTEKSNSNSN